LYKHAWDTEPKARILIVDDHPIVRHGMVQLINIQKDLHLCCEAGDADQALAAMRDCHHDVAIVDISLPGVSGFELIKTLTSRYANLITLVFSMHSDPGYAERALRAGARGYVTKQEATQNILFALRQVLKGGIYLSGQMQALILGQMVESSPHTDRSSLNRLSEREYEVLRLIGLGFGTIEIANKLKRSVKTIETHRATIKAKFGLATSAQLVNFACKWVSTEL